MIRAEMPPGSGRRAVGRVVKPNSINVTIGLGHDKPVEVVVPARPHGFGHVEVGKALGEYERSRPAGFGEVETQVPGQRPVLSGYLIGERQQPRRNALVDGYHFGRSVASLKEHPEGDLSLGGIAIPRAYPSGEAIRLGNCGPDVLHRCAESTGERDPFEAVAGLAAAGGRGLLSHPVSS